MVSARAVRRLPLGRLLGQRPISWWKNVKWTLEETDCGFDGLTPKAKADVLDIRKEMEGGKPPDHETTLVLRGLLLTRFHNRMKPTPCAIHQRRLADRTRCRRRPLNDREQLFA